MQVENFGLLCHLPVQDAKPCFHSSSAQLNPTDTFQVGYFLISLINLFCFLHTYLDF